MKFEAEVFEVMQTVMINGESILPGLIANHGIPYERSSKDGGEWL